MGRFRSWVSWAVDHSLNFYQGEPEESQQGEHYSNQAQREQERNREFVLFCFWVASKERYCRIEPIRLISR